jgi:membrane-bound inhibitor of C-type lysozyme
LTRGFWFLKPEFYSTKIRHNTTYNNQKEYKMKTKNRLGVVIAIVAISSLTLGANEADEKACNSICKDVVKVFDSAKGLSQKPEILSCKQEGDIDGDSLSLIEGTMRCKIGYMTDTGKGEMDMQRITNYTVEIKPEESEAKKEEDVTTYICGKKSFTVEFTKDRKAIFKMGDREALLSAVVSGSGFRYSDGVLTLSGKGDEASVEENGKALFHFCTVK